MTWKPLGLGQTRLNLKATVLHSLTPTLYLDYCFSILPTIMPTSTHHTHRQALQERWPPAKEAYRSLDDFGRVLETVLDTLSHMGANSGTVTDPRVAWE